MTAPLSASGQGLTAAEREIGKKFRASCIGCHTIPDKSFATDKAWLNRVKDTA
jgi:hypothetical protein